MIRRGFTLTTQSVFRTKSFLSRFLAAPLKLSSQNCCGDAKLLSLFRKCWQLLWVRGWDWKKFNSTWRAETHLALGNAGNSHGLGRDGKAVGMWTAWQPLGKQDTVYGFGTLKTYKKFETLTWIEHLVTQQSDSEKLKKLPRIKKCLWNVSA